MKTLNNEATPTLSQSMGEPHPSRTDVVWKPLYRVGAAAALFTVVLVLVSIPVFFLWPLPGGLQPTSATVIDCFTLLQKNWLLGLLALDLVMLVSTVLVIPIYLALSVSLRRASPSWIAIALMLGLIGAAIYFAVNPAFSMLFLSGQYAAASVAQKPVFVAAGQTMLATYQGTGFDMYYILGAVTTLIFSAVMLRSSVFNKTTAYLGLVTGFLMLVPPTIGTFGVYLSLLSLLPLVIWDLLITWQLFKLAQSRS